MKQAAVGFRVHSGWSALVTVSLENGAPTVLSRERVHLVETFIYKFRQPYHTAGRMPPEKGRAFVEGSLAEAKRLAGSALRSTQKELGNKGITPAEGAPLLPAAKTLPGVARLFLLPAVFPP